MIKSDLRNRQDIIKAYLKWISKLNRAPRWVYQFVESTEIEKDKFYEFFSDLNDLENDIWLEVFENTLKILQNDPTFQSFSLREKLLAFYYTLMEVMYDDRQALSLILGRSKITRISPIYLKAFKTNFDRFIAQLINEGIQSGEIANRTMVMNLYPGALWQQFLFLIRFWKNDTSEQLTATDEAIERTVNLGFDLMSHSVLDSLPGYGRFIYKSWSKDLK